MKLSNKILLGGFVFICLVLLGFIINIRIFANEQNYFSPESTHVLLIDQSSSSFLV